MTALAIIILVLVGLYIIVSVIRRKNPISKFTIILVVVAIAILGFQGQFGSKEARQEIVASELQQKAPSFQKAPYFVQTASRAYYIATYKDSHQYLTLTNYYYYDKKKWEFTSVPLPLDRRIYGNLQVLRRTEG